jgi:hypothetical protein
MKRFGKAAGILLAACALAMAQDPSTSAARGFRVSKPPEAPAVQAPSPLDDSFLGFDRSEVDIDALERYDDAVKFDRSDEDPAEKAQMWRELAQDLPKFADAAELRAREWGRFGAEKKSADAALAKRVAARDSDWALLAPLLSRGLGSKMERRAWSEEFLKAYFASPGVEPAMAKVLIAHVPAGPMRDALRKSAAKAPKSASPPTPPRP